jgi:hypothetical protein
MPLGTSWTATIARLSFCVASQHNRLPTPDQVFARNTYDEAIGAPSSTRR